MWGCVLFLSHLHHAPEIDIPVAQSTAVSSVNDALKAAEKIGYPVILRSAFTLGGLGSGFANNPDELRDLSAKSLSLSPQVLIERSMKGWKELEYEVVRDGADVLFTIILFTIDLLTYSRPRTLSFAVTWRTLIHLELILEILSSLPPPKHYQMMNTICFEVLLLKLFGILASSESVIYNTRLIRLQENTVSLRSTLGTFCFQTHPDDIL